MRSIVKDNLEKKLNATVSVHNTRNYTESEFYKERKILLGILEKSD